EREDHGERHGELSRAARVRASDAGMLPSALDVARAPRAAGDSLEPLDGSDGKSREDSPNWRNHTSAGGSLSPLPLRLAASRRASTTAFGSLP
ncbi:MAG: hypothetical protein ABI592_16595, partial [Acidobacteriota bacterium]